PNLSDFDSASLFSLHDRLLDTRPSVARALGDRLIARNARYPILTIDDPVEYEEELVRDSIIELLDSAVRAGYASRAVSWLVEFARFEKNTIYDINPDTFVPVVNLVFLQTDPYKRFVSDISFDRHQTQIVRSRMYLELTQKGVDER
ncbi:hypothetical protein NECAME_18069, partial [Necator americanus]